MKNFGDRLKEERERLGLSQGELAKLVDKKKGQSFISNFETGARKGTASIIELAHALGVDAYWLKTGEGDKNQRAVTREQDEETILEALPLLSKDLKDSWIMTARVAIERHEIQERGPERRKA